MVVEEQHPTSSHGMLLLPAWVFYGVKTFYLPYFAYIVCGAASVLLIHNPRNVPLSPLFPLDGGWGGLPNHRQTGPTGPNGAKRGQTGPTGP